jgi:hypothetical protein
MSSARSKTYQQIARAGVVDAFSSNDPTPQQQESHSYLNADAVASKQDATREWRDTELHRRWYSRIKQGYANDFIIAISPSSKTGISGTGKTTLAAGLAKTLDDSPGGYNAEEKSTLDAGELAYKVLPSIRDGSAIIFDEAQGAPGTDSVNSRRGMTSEAIDAINAILANRDQRVTLIIVIQQLSMMDKNLLPMVDAWLLIRKSPEQMGGPLSTHHKLYTNDYDLENQKTKTPAVEDLRWPKLPDNDPDYVTLEEKKQEAKRKKVAADGEVNEGMEVPSKLADMPQKHRDAIVTDLRNRGVSREAVADACDLSPSRISQITNSDD